MESWTCPQHVTLFVLSLHLPPDLWQKKTQQLPVMALKSLKSVWRRASLATGSEEMAIRLLWALRACQGTAGGTWWQHHEVPGTTGVHGQSSLGPRQTQRDDHTVSRDAEQSRIKRAQNWLTFILLPLSASCELFVLHLTNNKFKVFK